MLFSRSQKGPSQQKQVCPQARADERTERCDITVTVYWHRGCPRLGYCTDDRHAVARPRALAVGGLPRGGTAPVYRTGALAVGLARLEFSRVRVNLRSTTLYSGRCCIQVVVQHCVLTHVDSISCSCVWTPRGILLMYAACCILWPINVLQLTIEPCLLRLQPGWHACSSMFCECSRDLLRQRVWNSKARMLRRSWQDPLSFGIPWRTWNAAKLRRSGPKTRTSTITA